MAANRESECNIANERTAYLIEGGDRHESYPSRSTGCMRKDRACIQIGTWQPELKRGELAAAGSIGEIALDIPFGRRVRIFY